MEGENPTRRYKWFRPRQAMRGFISQTGNSNFGTCLLYNNSSASHLLVVRSIMPTPDLSSNYTVGVIQGLQGTAGGTVQSVMAGDANKPGMLSSLDAAAAYAQYVSILNPQFTFNFDLSVPLFVLPPGWSAFVQDLGGGANIDCAFLWEAIYPDELDWLF